MLYKYNTLKIIVILFSLMLSYPAVSFAYEPDEMINISVYERINPSIVSIDAQVSDGFST